MEQKDWLPTLPLKKVMLNSTKRTSCPAQISSKDKTLFRITRHKKVWRTTRQLPQAVAKNSEPEEAQEFEFELVQTAL